MSGDPHASPNFTHCENCGTALAGPYCHRCGQHAIAYRQSFRHLAHDTLENLFHFDGKFFVSVTWLLARPGRLTVEFNAGRRQSQVPPLRFYIFVTVLFFLGVHLLNHGHLIPVNEQVIDVMSREVVKSTKTGVNALAPEQRIRLAELMGAATERKHAPLTAKESDALVEQVRRESATTTAEAAHTGVHTKVQIDETSALGRAFKAKLVAGELTFSGVVEALEHRVPTLLFLGMPVFALLLKLFYWRSGRYYIEHLVFSLHLHTWVFLAIMIGSGYLDLAELGPGWLASLAGWMLFGWMAWYAIAAMRVVYGEGWGRTTMKAGALGLLYLFALFGLEMGLIALTLMWLVYA